MPCCKSEQFGNWCADVDELVTHEGREYCIFHAPAECEEKIDVDGFNDKVFARIDRAKEEEWNKCDLRGTIFPGDIRFRQYGKENPLPAINFNEAAFSGEADFNQAAFSGEADFNQAAFSGEADFNQAAFSGEVNFIAVVFSGYAYFSEAAFSGDAYFVEAAFSGHAYFRQAAFSRNAYFSKAAFSGHAYFRQAAFSGDADFWEAALSEDAYFTKAKFEGIALFNQAKFFNGSSFSNAEFENISTFDQALFSSAEFSYTTFQKPAYFRQTEFQNASFSACFAGAHLEFERAQMCWVSLNRAPLESFRFIDCQWQKSHGRNTLFDACCYLPLDNGKDLEEPKERPGPGHLADQFRRLKKIAIEEKDHSLASDWHYHQKEMERLAARENGKRAMRAVLEVYKYIAGYGEAPRNAIITLLVLLSLPLVLQYGLPLVGTKLPGKALSYLPWVKASGADLKGTWVPLISGIYKLFITIQAGLFGLALRNKLRR